MVFVATSILTGLGLRINKELDNSFALMLADFERQHQIQFCARWREASVNIKDASQFAQQRLALDQEEQDWVNDFYVEWLSHWETSVDEICRLPCVTWLENYEENPTLGERYPNTRVRWREELSCL